MKKIQALMRGALTLLTSVLLVMNGYAETVTIGECTSSNSMPINTYYRLGATQSIYTAKEIGCSGFITSIRYDIASYGEETFVSEVDIYMGHKKEDSFLDSYDYLNLPELISVYRGGGRDLSHNTTFYLDIPFEYNGIDNLVIVICTQKNSQSTRSGCTFFCSEAKGKCLYRVSDLDDEYGCVSYDGYYRLSNYRADVQLTIEPKETIIVDGIKYLKQWSRIGQLGFVLMECDKTKSGNLMIPEKLLDDSGNEYPVSSIASNAFRDCSSLTSISIPGSVNSIMSMAFQYCI